MIPLKKTDILGLADRIGKHYSANIANRFIRPALGNLDVERRDWDQVESLTDNYEYYRIQGFHLDDLYLKILAMARVVSVIRRSLLPNLKSAVMPGVERAIARGNAGAGDKILAEMAVQNFPSNLDILKDLLNDLYFLTVEEDKSQHPGKKPLFERMPELASIGQLLVG